MKIYRIIPVVIIILILIALINNSFAATINATGNGNWNSTVPNAPWSGGVVPTAGDAVIINTYQVVVNVSNASCASLALGSGATATLSFNAGSALTVAGNVSLGGSGAKNGNINMTNGGHLICSSFSGWKGVFTSGAGTVEVNGSNPVFGSNDYLYFNNLILSNGANVELGASIHIYGDLTLKSGSTLTSSAEYLYLYKDWTLESGAVFNCGSTTNDYVAFKGSNTQNLSGNITMNRIWADKTDNYDINFNGDITVNSGLWFDGGIFKGIGNSKIIFVDGANTISNPNSIGCISASVKKIGDDAFTYPLCSGDETNYSPLSISDPGVDPTVALTATYYGVDPNRNGFRTSSRESSLDQVSNHEYWTLERNSGTPVITVSLSWGSWSGSITNQTDMKVTRWDGIKWIDQGNTSSWGTAFSGGIASATTSNFGQFTLASSSSDNILPVELLDFTGACENGKVNLSWTTSSETNNDFFTIEKSGDALNWESVAKVRGAGTSNKVIHYQYSLYANTEERTYFRLTQTDYNGKEEHYSPIDVAACSGNEDFIIYPNPSDGHFEITAKFADANSMSVKIFNNLGKLVWQSEDASLQYNLSFLSNGFYYIHLDSDDKTLISKLVIR